MPFMDGEETFDRLPSIRPDVVVLLSTGFIAQERLDRMMQAGIAGFLRKPHRPDELVANIGPSSKDRNIPGRRCRVVRRDLRSIDLSARLAILARRPLVPARASVNWNCELRFAI